MSRPTVSVIVLNWNGREYLAECLTSLRALDYAGPYEIVLVDNDSTDGSVEYVRQAFPEVHIVVSPSNLGFGGGNNLGVQEVASEAVAFLNNDARVEPSWLTELVAVLTSGPEVAAAGGKILSWDGRWIDFLAGGSTLTGFGVQLGYRESADGQSAESKDILAPCGGSMIAWRERFLEVGGFDADYFLFYEDVDLGWRFWLRGWRVRSAPRSVAYHRHHGSTARIADQRVAVLYERNALFTIYKNYDDAHLAVALPAALILAAEKSTLLANPDRSAYSVEAAVVRSGPKPPPVAPAAGDWQRLRAAFRQQGWGKTARRLPGAARRRGGRYARRLRDMAVRRWGGQPEGLIVPPVGISTLLAIEQFGEQLPVLRKKRAAIQASRRRADEEILPLFGQPLQPLAPIDGFANYHRHVMASLQLDLQTIDSCAFMQARK